MLIEVQPAGSAADWAARAGQSPLTIIGRAWAPNSLRAVELLDREKPEDLVRLVLWFDMRVAPAVARIAPRPACERLDAAIQRTLLDARGLYYVVAPFGMRRTLAVLSSVLRDGRRLRPLDQHTLDALEERWLRAIYRAVALPTPPELAPDAGLTRLAVLNRLPQAERSQPPVTRLVADEQGQPRGAVAVRVGQGPLWASMRDQRLLLPAFEEIHPQLRETARWQQTTAFYDDLTSNSVRFRPVGGSRRRHYVEPDPPARATNQFLVLTARVPSGLEGRVSQQAVQRAFARTYPEADSYRICAVGYQIEPGAVHVRLSLLSAIPGATPFTGRNLDFSDNLRREIEHAREPLPPSHSMAPISR